MGNPANLNSEIAARVLEANAKNIVAKVKAGGTLNASERAIMESAMSPTDAAAPQPPAASASPALPASLIDRAAAQPGLFSLEEMGAEYIGHAARRGQYTAEELFSHRPEIYHEIVRLLAQAASIRHIKRVCKVHHYSVRAVAEREGQTIDTLRLSIGKRALNLAALLVDTIEEDVLADRLKPGEKAFALSTLVDKGQLLTGAATARIEQGKASDKDELEDWLMSAKPATAIDITASVSPAAMDYKTRTEIAVPPADSAADCTRIVTPDAEPCKPTSIDCQSTVSPSVDSVTPAEYPVLYPPSPVDFPPRPGARVRVGGGGIKKFQRPPNRRIHYDRQNFRH